MCNITGNINTKQFFKDYIQSKNITVWTKLNYLIS